MILIPQAIYHIAATTGYIAAVDCMKCHNPLTLKETKAQEHYCQPCRRLVEAHEHNELLGKQIARANRVLR